MRKREKHRIMIKPYLPGLVEASLQATTDDYKNESAQVAIRLWILTNIFPTAKAGDLLRVVQGEMSLIYSDDGLTAEITNHFGKTDTGDTT